MIVSTQFHILQCHACSPGEDDTDLPTFLGKQNDPLSLQHHETWTLIGRI